MGDIFKSRCLLIKARHIINRTLAMSSALKHGSTLNSEEVDKFRLMAGDWWNPGGVCMPLHSMNRLRIPLIRDGLIHTNITNPELVNSATPLLGTKILDVGCGAGIVSEQLARIGAEVTGLDAAMENIEAAKIHMHGDQTIAGRLTYKCSSLEDHASSCGDLYDAVVASEVIEHVENQPSFVNLCASVVKPNGSCFFTTMNRNNTSWLAAIVCAEYVLGLLPKGTHDWNKFVTPQELEEMLDSAGCRTRLVHGMFYIPGINKWQWIEDKGVNYALQAVNIKDTNLDQIKDKVTK